MIELMRIEFKDMCVFGFDHLFFIHLSLYLYLVSTRLTSGLLSRELKGDCNTYLSSRACFTRYNALTSRRLCSSSFAISSPPSPVFLPSDSEHVRYPLPTSITALRQHAVRPSPLAIYPHPAERIYILLTLLSTGSHKIVSIAITLPITNNRLTCPTQSHGHRYLKHTI